MAAPGDEACVESWREIGSPDSAGVIGVSASDIVARFRRIEVADRKNKILQL